MVNFKNILLLIFCINLGVCVMGQSGGQSGATQLLINPWAKSSGVGGANVSFGKGIESVYMNPAGIAGTEKTDLLFIDTLHTYTQLTKELELHSKNVNKYMLLIRSILFNYSKNNKCSDSRNYVFS